MTDEIKMKFIINYKDTLEQEIISMKNKLIQYNIEFEKVQKFILENCQHEWIDDHIDQMNGYKQAIPIRYCDKCLLTATDS